MTIDQSRGKKMNNYRIIGQVASVFGVIFVVFAAFAAIVNYLGITAEYAVVTTSVLQYYVLNGMLPFLLFAALSFTVAAVLTRSSRDETAEMKPEELPAQASEVQPTEPEQ